jgi:hypothetical protein
MPHSRYPRTGHPLAPRLLKQFLIEPVPPVDIGAPSGTLVQLSDLDATSWSRWNPVTCECLGTRVVECVRRAVAQDPRLREVRLPILPAGTLLGEIELEVRTYNCVYKLLRMRPRDKAHALDLSRLSGVTVGELLDTRNFGAKTLVDLLTSLDAWLGSLGTRTDANPEKAVLTLRTSSLQGSLFSQGADPGRIAVPRDTPKPPAQRNLSFAVTFEARKLEILREASSIRADDPRFGTLLRAFAPDDVCVADAARRIATRSRDPSQAEALLDKMRALRAAIRTASRCRSIEEELAELACVLRQPKHRQAALTYLGWDGGGGASLQHVAERFGVSREYVRQVSKKVVDSLAGCSCYAPRLDAGLTFVNSRVPRVASRLEEELRVAGLTQTDFRIESLMKAAEVLGRRIRFRIEDADGVRVVVRERSTFPIGRVVPTARRLIEHWGVTTFADVSATLGEGEAGEPSLDIVRDILIARTDYRPLDDTGHWFCLVPTPRNRLLNQTRKVVSVAGSIGISELRAAVGRHHRVRGIAPPRGVLQEFCRHVGGFRVDGTAVCADPPLDWRRTLAETERTMVEILTANGGAMRRTDLESECRDRGINGSTFYVYLGYSPVITRLASGVYGLVGAPLEPEAVESLRRPRRWERRLLDYSWTEEGHVWLEYRLSETMIGTGVVSIPAALAPLLAGDFDLEDDDGEYMGAVAVGGSNAWGLGSFFRRRGGEEDDIMRLVFDLGRRLVRMTVRDAYLSDHEGVEATGTMPEEFDE